MSKIMLVLENKDDQNFLEKILSRLHYQVIAMRHGLDLSEQLIDHFPDVVFAATLGKNERTLSALGKIKEMRGKPKLVFVKQEKESGALSEEQKRIIDGVLYSPIDPFKLIDVLADTTETSITELRRRYNESIELDRKSTKAQVLRGTSDRTNDSISVTGHVQPKNVESSDIPIKETKTNWSHKEEGNKQSSTEQKKENQSTLIYDSNRSEKYKNYLKNVKKPEDSPDTLDGHRVRKLQKQQSEQIHENDDVKKNRKHFLKTLFSTNPEDVKKNS